MNIWITPLLSLVGAMVGAAVVLWMHLRETSEQYRKVTFEQRLKIHQEALSCCYKVYHCISQSKAQEDKYDVINQMEQWWENNCLSLDEKSRRKTLNLIGVGRDYVSGFDKSQSEFYQTFREALKTIAEGIGTKHLIELKDLKIEDKTFQG